MRPQARLWLAPVLAGILLGCGEGSDPGTNDDAPLVGDAAAPEAVEGPEMIGEPTEESPAPTSADVDLQTTTPEELEALIAENSGKVVLVDFWATWCIPCLQQYPHTVELSETHADDLVVYSVSMDETDEATLARVKEQLGQWPAGNVRTLINASGADPDAFSAFEITEGALPHYKVYGRDGELVATLGGTENVPTAETVDAALDEAFNP